MHANNSLAETFLPKAREFSSLHSILLVLGGTIALAISSKIQVPFYPVPLTMQTFVLLSLSIAYGPRLATATVLLYLFEGAIGLPVFAFGGGLAYFAGPSAGYLFGFVIAAFACGWLARMGWDRNVFTAAFAMVIGNALIYIPGLLWLALVSNQSALQVVHSGFLIFLLPDAVKIALAAAMLPLAWKWVRQNTPDEG